MVRTNPEIKAKITGLLYTYKVAKIKELDQADLADFVAGVK
jgi:hypothetical protein